MGKVERTDQERWAWCFTRSADVSLWNFDKRGVSVLVPTQDCGYVKRHIKSKGKTQEMWRRCVDELMNKETT